jgi:uncharacterized membrane protein YgcG
MRAMHAPTQVVFAVDLDSEMTSEAVPGCTRFDAVVHAITTFVSAKVRRQKAKGTGAAGGRGGWQQGAAGGCGSSGGC